MNNGFRSRNLPLIGDAKDWVVSFCLFMRVLKLECLKLKTGLNHLSSKAKLCLKVVQAARGELNRLRAVHSSLVVQPTKIQLLSSIHF
jgi:hypothetical protein